MRVSGRAKYYCQVSSWWDQHEVPVLPSVSTILVMTHLTHLVLRGSDDDWMRVWTIALTEYAFMSGAVFLVKPSDGACPSYFTLNPEFENMGGSILF